MCHNQAKKVPQFKDCSTKEVPSRFELLYTVLQTAT